MSSPIPLLLLPLILILSSSMINVCNARQLSHCHKDHCKIKSSPAETKMKQETTPHGEVTIARGACIEQKTDVAVNEAQGRTSDAVSGAENIRFLYTVSSGTNWDKAKERESAEYHLDYIGPQIHPPTHN